MAGRKLLGHASASFSSWGSTAAGAAWGACKPPSARGRGAVLPAADGGAPRGHCRRELEPRRLQPPPHCQAGGGEAKAACVATQCVQHALAQEASGRRTDSTNTREQSNEVLMPGSGDCSLEAARPVPACSGAPRQLRHVGTVALALAGLSRATGVGRLRKRPKGRKLSEEQMR